MKKLLLLVTTAALVLGLYSCNEETYAQELKAEQKIIDAFIERQGIHVLESWPTDSVFAENEYVLLESGVYFQLVSKGSGNDTARVKDIIALRYMRYSLTEYADTTSYMQTDYPIEFQYGNYSDENACNAFHEAVSYMKRNNSEARMIVPSKQGFSSDMRPATPYGYDMKIKIKK
ncbi:MAG: DUF4827 family protein [Bacteroidetes bacterium]|uniref:DUF4827 family protein n=1 Tax=Candidatus Gallipaludibacter merdavium TaxID=2840839 RepID=A0A9D9N3G4_9BACT|nr:DUF4827 family protein [Candidatus Gallipaludibacter merdavium]